MTTLGYNSLGQNGAFFHHTEKRDKNGKTGDTGDHKQDDASAINIV